MSLPSTGYDLLTVSNPSSAETDFTLKIDLSLQSASFKAAWNVSGNGYGRASKGDGTTELACDWVDLDNSAKTGWVYIKWSGVLASTGTQEVFLWPPNTANSQYDRTATYGRDNAYKSTDVGIYPIYGDNNSPITDRTVNAENCTWSSSNITIVSDTIVFERPHDGVALMAAKPLDGSSAFTISVKVKTNTFNNDGGIFYTALHSANQPILMWFDDLGKIGVLVSTSEQDIATKMSTTALSTNVFYSIVLTLGGGFLRLYIDGIEDTGGNFPVSLGGSVDTSSAANYTIGNSSDVSRALDGDVTDIKIKTDNDSESWVAHDYYQTSNNSAFWGTRAWVPVAAGGSPWFFNNIILSRRR